MAYKNKTQLAATITALAATVDLELHDKPQRSELVESLMCLLDRETTANSGISATLAIDFDSYDLIKSTLSAPGLAMTYNITNLKTGDIKFLWVEKLGGDTITFSGVTSLIPDADYFDSYVGSVLFMLLKKGSATPYLFPLTFLGDYLKVSENGSDIDNPATFRTSIDVYSKAEAQAVLKVVNYTACTRVSSKVVAASFNVKAAQFGNIVTITGNIEMNGNAVGEVLFTLPSTIDICNTEISFSAINSDTSRIEMFIDYGTRNVYSYNQYSDGATMKFCVSYIAI